MSLALTQLIGFGAGGGIGGNDTYTVLLLHCDGADASTTFTDSAIGGGAPHTMTVSGNAQIDTAQSKFGGASGLFDGSGDDVYVSGGSSDFAFGTGDFTVDMWIRPHTVTGGDYKLLDTRQVGSGNYVSLSQNAATITFWDTSSKRIDSGTILTLDTWGHLALVKASGTTKMYYNGTQVGSSYTDSNNYARTGCVVGSNGAGSQYFNGWIDEFRISKGIARWTANFTPPPEAYG